MNYQRGGGGAGGAGVGGGGGGNWPGPSDGMAARQGGRGQGGGGWQQGGGQRQGPYQAPGQGSVIEEPQEYQHVTAATIAEGIITEITNHLLEATTEILVNPETSTKSAKHDTGNVTLPAPCYLIGRPSMIGVYIGTGFIIPVLALCFVLYIVLKRLFMRKIMMKKEYESLEDEDEEIDAAPKTPHLDKIKALVLAKENQTKVMKWIGEASSPQTKHGQNMMIAGVFCSTLSLVCYLGVVSIDVPSVEICGTLPNAQQILDFLANVFLLFYFVIRLIGSEKKMKVLVDPYSLIDYFCIPSVIIQVFLNRYFTGFTFLRAYNFLWLVEILANRGAFKTANSVKLTYLVLLVIITLMIAAGFLHLVENVGDFYPLVDEGVYDGQQVSFWRCFLYLYGKVTLIDLSGIRVMTMLGKLIIYAFQLVALGIIGRAIPQIIALLRITPEYDKDYIAPERFLHIIISGHVTASSIGAFLREFYHPDRDISDHFRIVILGDKPPDENMERLLKQFFNKADYRRGSILSLMDLNRVKLFEAAATLLVADKAAAESDAEDAVNIMRVVSIKNFKDDARVIVQLLQYHNKAYLQNIPSWNVQAGDIVICIAELRLGLLAQSCYAPGFSTLMANFFTTRSFSERKKYNDAWLMDYSRGTSLEMYARRMSDAFAGMTFTQACEFCYLRLKIVLVAIKTDSSDLATMPQVNPPPDCIAMVGSIGYFIADSTEEVERAMYYCALCHRDVDDPTQIKKCACQMEAEAHEDDELVKMVRGGAPPQQMTRARDDLYLEGKIWSFIRRYPTSPARSITEGQGESEPQLGVDPGSSIKRQPEKAQAQYDSTGMFHWCPGRPIESVLMSRQQAARAEFSGHIVICVISTPGSQIVGLHSFVLPLRSAVIKPEEIRDIVILSDHAFMRKEWQYILNLPRINIVRGTALNRADLRSVTLNTCKMCVILGAPSTGVQMVNVDNALIDKSVILATLNVRAMKFSEDEAVEMVSSQPPSEMGSVSETDSMYQQRKSMQTRARQTGYEVPLITDLIRDTNAQFLDQDDDDKPGTEFYMTQPYACGRAFAGTVLDLLMITSFFNPVIVNVFRTMIFGGASLELEKILAEGAGLIGGTNISKPAQLKNQVLVNQFSISSGPLSVHAESTYGGLFIDALVSFGRLCLGVYRKMDPTDDSSRAAKRFVITNPPEDFILDPTDLLIRHISLIVITMTHDGEMDSGLYKDNFDPIHSQQGDLELAGLDGGEDQREEKLRRLKARLEDWRPLVLPVVHFLEWRQPWSPAVLAGVNTVFFLVIWWLDLSALSCLALLGTVVAFLDGIVPIISSTVFDPNAWSSSEEQEYDAFCHRLMDLSSYASGFCTYLRGVKAQLPRVFSIGLCGLFIVAAIVFDRVNNFFIIYLETTLLLLAPGLHAKGVLKLAQHHGLELINKIRGSRKTVKQN
ncbi:Calcium-activated potassium channel slowpoke [Hypsibius exemplaris]|uniref:Calcium-activated potassium channel slowpoke n=1 Tax=Hypsibius exemplaris TaxID=2072580 RepID=A0A1W0X0M9_HYPEX|nr:Calcium-activated potassium channel slowpoke [Hypsibius exemplaris]